MCSIIGFKAKTKENHQDKVEDYLKILEDRGDQSFGYFYITEKGKVFYAKSLSLTPLIKDIKAMPKGSWCFLHARKASAGMAGTTTDDKIAKAHPVESDDKSIILLHNGTKTSIHDTVKGSISDSQGLATLLSVMWESREILASSLGVVIYERENKVYLYKDGTRPLVFAENCTIFASEPIDDKVKWCNIGHTTTGGFDVELDFKAKNLGLKIGKPIKIEFNISSKTVKNFQVAGMPKVSLCSTCKKKHIEQKANYSMCCTCIIEQRKTATSVTTVTTKAQTARPPQTKTVIPSATKVVPTGGNTKLPVSPSRQGITVINRAGVLTRSNISVPTENQLEIFTSDVNILKALGFDSVIWKGWATVRTNVIYKNTNGALFVVPDANGSHIVKVDRIFVDKDNPIYTHAYSSISSKTLKIIGDIDNTRIFAIKGGMDISTGVRNVSQGDYKLETFVMPNGLNGNPNVKEGSLVGFRSLENK